MAVAACRDIHGCLKDGIGYAWIEVPDQPVSVTCQRGFHRYRGMQRRRETGRLVAGSVANVRSNIHYLWMALQHREVRSQLMRTENPGDAARLTPSPTQTMEPDASIMKWSFAKGLASGYIIRAAAIANVRQAYPVDDSN